MSSLRRNNSDDAIFGSWSSQASRAALRRHTSEPNLFPFQHFDVVSRSWAGGLPSAGSTSPRVQQLHREMLSTFEQAVEANEVVQVSAVSPRTRTRPYEVNPEPRRKPAQKRLRLVNRKREAAGGHASRDGSPVAAAVIAAGCIGQPAAPRTVPLWFMQFKRRLMERLERDAVLLFLDGLFLFALICVYCHVFK